MSRESIWKIKEIEEEAERIVGDARRRAQEIVAAAEAEGRETCERVERETSVELSAMLEKIHERTVLLTERTEETCAEESAALRERVALRRRAAEKIIIGGVERKCR